MTTQDHLADVVAQHGSGDATLDVREILRTGLFAMEAAKKAAWHAKTNPSISDAGKCVRQVAYSLQNIPESNPPTEDSLANFEVGHAIEEVMARILVAAGASPIREGRVAIPVGDTRVTGRKDFDGVTLLMRGRIIELKSISSRAMSWMLKRKEEGRDSHRRQLRLYCYAESVESGVLVYWVKDATKGEPVWHAWHVPLDRNLAEADLWQLAAVDKMVKEGITPERPDGYTKSYWECSYCNYKDHCWSLK